MGRVPHCCWSPFMQIWPAPLVNRHSGSRTPGMWKLCILGQASLDHLLLVSQHFTSAVWPCEEVDFLWTERNQQFFCCIRRAWYFCVNNNTTVANAANAHRRTLYLEQQTSRHLLCCKLKLLNKHGREKEVKKDKHPLWCKLHSVALLHIHCLHSSTVFLPSSSSSFLTTDADNYEQ